MTKIIAKVREQDKEFIHCLLGNEAFNEDGILTDDSLSKIKEAYTRSHEIRKFEIELYWKRATYFWAFITTVTAVFGVCIKNTTSDYFILSPVVATIGFITALCFYYVNLGSKYWQENWENNVDNLEFYVSGHLYKINYFNKSGFNYSVSRVNNELSLFITFIWFLVFIGSMAYVTFKNNYPNYTSLLIVLYSMGFIMAFLYFTLRLQDSIGGTHDDGCINYHVRNDKISKYKMSKKTSDYKAISPSKPTTRSHIR